MRPAAGSTGPGPGVVAAVEAGMPIWAAFGVDSKRRVRAGEVMEDAEKVLREAGASALLINCTQAPLADPA